MTRFIDRTVLVTGASRGIGRGIALAFAAEGAFVFVNYRAREREAADTVEHIVSGGGRAVALAFDVRDRDAVDAGIARVVDQRGRIDVLVNNAAIVSDQLLGFLSVSDWDDVVATNLTGAFNCCRSAARPMLRQKAGALVNIASVAALRASPGQANYAAAKGGLVALTRTVAAELAGRGVRVNAVLPGLVDAGMAARLDHRVAGERRKRIPMGRFGTAEEVARVVLFAASDDASYMTGQVLVVDGGLTL